MRHITRTQLPNMILSVVETGRMKQKTGVGRLPGIFGKRAADSPALPCPFGCWMLPFAVYLRCFCKGMDARGVYEQIVAVDRVSCTQNGQ